MQVCFVKYGPKIFYLLIREIAFQLYHDISSPVNGFWRVTFTPVNFSLSHNHVETVSYSLLCPMTTPVKIKSVPVPAGIA